MLTEAGYTVQSMDKDQAASEYNLEIRLLPSFYIVKAGIPAYPMYGIQNMDTILNWAKSANI
jgi:hypothetical protein